MSSLLKEVRLDLHADGHTVAMQGVQVSQRRDALWIFHTSFDLGRRCFEASLIDQASAPTPRARKRRNAEGVPLIPCHDGRYHQDSSSSCFMGFCVKPGNRTVKLVDDTVMDRFLEALEKESPKKHAADQSPDNHCRTWTYGSQDDSPRLAAGQGHGAFPLRHTQICHRATTSIHPDLSRKPYPGLRQMASMAGENRALRRS